MKIFKYPIKTVDTQVVQIPKSAKILCVQTQFEKPCMWALVDEESTDKSTRTLAVHGTGHPIYGVEHKEYIGTYQLREGQLIFHVFEIVNV